MTTWSSDASPTYDHVPSEHTYDKLSDARLHAARQDYDQVSEHRRAQPRGGDYDHLSDYARRGAGDYDAVSEVRRVAALEDQNDKLAVDHHYANLDEVAGVLPEHYAEIVEIAPKNDYDVIDNKNNNEFYAPPPNVDDAALHDYAEFHDNHNYA